MSDPVAEAAAQLAAQAPEATQEVPPTGEPVSSPSAPAPVVEAPTSTAASDVPQQDAEVPNAAPAAVESTTEPASAPSAAGADTTSTIAASSDEPLHVRVARHLEAIFQMVKSDTQPAPTEAEEHAAHVKAHIGDVLHRISNGMEVAEGEMVQKLEALYRLL